MADIIYSPKCLSEKGSELTGTVTLRVPTFQERMKYIEEAKVDLNQNNEDGATVAAKNAASTRVLVDLAKAHVKAVNIKEKDGNLDFKTFDELCEDNRCDPIIMEIAWLMVQGFRPGKNSKPS